MDEFKGSKCIVCGNVFTDNDDIVVCPDCGTPYHRACYKSVGSCVNHELHESKGSWQPEVTEVIESETSDTLCTRCGKQNPENALFCEACGYPLNSIIKEVNGTNEESEPEEIKDNFIMYPHLINYTDPCCGLNPDEEFDGVKVSEIADYVDKNTHYYIPIFKNFKTFGKHVSWNLSALLAPELYFANRKMILAALGALILRLIFLIPNVILAYSQVNAGELSEFAKTFNTDSTAFSMFAFICMVADFARMWFFCTNANGIYYKKVIRDIKNEKLMMTVQAAAYGMLQPDGLSEVLRKKGGTSVFWLTLFICLLILPFALIYVYTVFNMALPISV
ncbi:MAG: zinc-ribbon domain-containing protein [Ruminococcus sp.]|jgi:ribosomal protein L37E|nr:zinc-ribbon domain-containing protein [Ruminococcus sp.]